MSYCPLHFFESLPFANLDNENKKACIKDTLKTITANGLRFGQLIEDGRLITW